MTQHSPVPGPVPDASQPFLPSSESAGPPSSWQATDQQADPPPQAAWPHSAPATASAPLPAPGTTPPDSAALPRPRPASPASAQAAVRGTDIATLPPAAQSTAVEVAPVNPRKGEPVRPWGLWLSAALLFASAGVSAVALGFVFWGIASPGRLVDPEHFVRSDTYPSAAWLTSVWPFVTGSPWRVVVAVACAAIGFLVSATTSVVGYYAFHGYRWTRIGGLVATTVAALGLMLNQLAWASLPLAALAAIWVWLPSSRRYFARWHALRHPELPFSAPIEHVEYGPLPRFR